jgi:hypothetical protein
VRAPRDPRELEKLLAREWIYPQDALLLSVPLHGELVARGHPVIEEASRLETIVDAREKRIRALDDELLALRSSRSWRITRPLRAVSDLLAGRR